MAYLSGPRAAIRRRWVWSPQQFAALNDDRIGRCLDQLFRCDCGSLALAVATKAVAEFDVELDELHNDSTTVTFSGAYLDAAQETPWANPAGDHLRA
jgi:hypothetical protein